MLPTAVNDSDKFICVLLQPNESSNGATNCPKAYCPAPTVSIAAKNGAEITHQPAYMRGRGKRRGGRKDLTIAIEYNPLFAPSAPLRQKSPQISPKFPRFTT